MNRKIVFTNLIGDTQATKVATDALDVSFSTPDGTYGIIDPYSAETVVLAGTQLSRVGVGTYEYDYVEGIPEYDHDKNYHFSIRVTHDHGNIYYMRGRIPAQDLASEGAGLTLDDYRLTIGELADKVLLILGDPNGERYDKETTVFNELNNAMVEYAVKTRSIRDVMLIVVPGDTVSVDFKSAADQSGRELLGIERIIPDSGDGRPILPTTLDNLDTRGFSHQSGNPSYAYIDNSESGIVRFWPEISSNDTFKVYYYGYPYKPVDINDAHDVMISPLYYDAITFLAASFVLFAEEDSALIKDAIEYKHSAEGKIEENLQDYVGGYTVRSGAEPL